jgi:TolA-binding protein
VKPGENFQEAIVRALRQARVMLLVFSSNANNSEEIKKELVLAGRHHVTVIPVRVEDVAPNDAFAYEFATRQWIDLFQDWEQEIENLSLQIKQILESAPPEKTVAAEHMVPAFSHKKSHAPTVIGALVLLVLLLGGALAWWQPWRNAPPALVAATAPAQSATPVTPAAPAQTAPASPATTPAPTPASAATTQKSFPKPQHVPPKTREAINATAPPASSVPPPPPVADPEGDAWQNASNANTSAGFSSYMKAFPGGAHVQEAQQHLVMLILNSPATGSAFDGRWQTTWNCPNIGSYLGYTYQFEGQVKDGVYHGLKGEKGQPSSMVLDGKIESDGAAAFSGEVIVGSSMTGLGVARGTASDFQAAALFTGGSAEGRRLEGRACSLSFSKQ